MIKIDSLLSQIKLAREANKKSSSIIFHRTDFLPRLTKRNVETGDYKYPKIIKFPKSMESLRQGDFEPERRLVLDQPPTIDDQPIWTRSALKGVELQYGYENGDVRYFSEIKLGNVSRTSAPHYVLGGSSGSGKSACTNNVISNILLSYAPWEVELYLIDAKIAEFKLYGDEGSTPHIKAIAATEDTGYCVSILEELIKEMTILNAEVFSKAGAKDYPGFVKKTGLAIARKVIIIDEYQYLFLNAGKYKKAVADLLNKFATVGRSAGYHLYLASQGICTEVTEILNNIGLRGCLNAPPKISNTILGNEASAGLIATKGMGWLNINTTPDNQDISDNQLFKIPLVKDGDDSYIGDVPFYLKELRNIGESLNIKTHTCFYDENKKYTAQDIRDNVQLMENKNNIVIGEPSFMCSTPTRYELKFNFKDIANLCATAREDVSLQNIYKTFMINAEFNGARHKVLTQDMDIAQFTPSSVKIYEMSDAHDCVAFDLLLKIIQRKKVLIEADRLIATQGIPPMEKMVFSKEYLVENIPSIIPTELNIARVEYIRYLLEKSKYLEAFGVKVDKYSNPTPEQISEFVFNTIPGILNMTNLNEEFERSFVTKDKLPPTFIHIYGYNKILGFMRGRDAKILQRFAKNLFDANAANTTFILYSTSFEDCYEIKGAIAHVLADRAPKQFRQVAEGADYPENLPEICQVYYDKLADKIEIIKKPTLSEVS